jgi:chromosome segregation protein
MHLKQLKLAGFKSFVEPTVIPFSSQLVAVVGPNGCGKSNIIDAVRWVMGESSAKSLRGESMADVIFKGSSSRKPVGQASVELIFDNSMGRITGQYASYQEIAIKRLVTRDGESTYFLNGSRCRRRDVADIFLGTGAGARGYSIIGQNTISRLIEAHPDDLRTYLEEAAGVSKYKERRRETLQRITSTRENLSRVADIREELVKQLSRLERQAKAAEHYTQLKQEERLCRAEILALKWRDLTSEQREIDKESQQLTDQHDQQKTKIAALIKESANLSEALQQANDQHQQIQPQFYQLATEMARLEASIQQRQKDKQRLIADKQQLESEEQRVIQQWQQAQEALQPCEATLKMLQQELSAQQNAWIEQEKQVEKQQQQAIAWNAEWQQTLEILNKTLHDAERASMQIQNIEQRQQQLQINVEKNQSERSAMDLVGLQTELLSLQEQQKQSIQQQQIATEKHTTALQEGAALQQQLTDIERDIQQLQDVTQKLIHEHAALLAMQTALLQQPFETYAEIWKKHTRLAELMTVDEPWIKACELVLDECLQAIVLNSIEELWPYLTATADAHDRQNIERPVFTGIFIQTNTPDAQPGPYPRLIDKIKGPQPAWLNTLENIFVAENIDEARRWLPQINAYQSIITQEGLWLGHGWVRIPKQENTDEVGLLQRKQRLLQLKATLDQHEYALIGLQAKRDELRQSLIAHEAQQRTLKQQLTECLDESRATDAHLKHKQQLCDQTTKRHQWLMEEYETLLSDLETNAAQHIDLSQQYQTGLHCKTALEEQKNQLMAQRTCWEEALNLSRQTLETTRKNLHQTELDYNRTDFTAQQLRSSIEREQQQLDLVHKRLQTLAEHTAELDSPRIDLQSQLAQKIELHTELNGRLSQARARIDDLQQTLRETERQTKLAEQDAEIIQTRLQQFHLRSQTLEVHMAHVRESLNEQMNHFQEPLLKADITLPMLEKTLHSLEDEIKRLGAINLLAIEEYKTDLHRKNHIDLQYQDLTDALATLELAIHKMDKETRQRLKETFEQINASFQTLFPRLFGGGHAKLELTCDNLLEAGILVMAQPPGKRNTTIHLLSGGEKAMTAVALVFAIFQLNPSPFCMLDEVDAPLDDANIRRFCELVREMSSVVQFLFITHNKVTMELADHLIGVTMREPGVSRIVTVDVEAMVHPERLTTSIDEQ